MDTLQASTRALEATDDATYTSIENAIAKVTGEPNALAAQIRAALNAAAFDARP